MKDIILEINIFKHDHMIWSHNALGLSAHPSVCLSVWLFVCLCLIACLQTSTFDLNKVHCSYIVYIFHVSDIFQIILTALTQWPHYLQNVSQRYLFQHGTGIWSKLGMVWPSLQIKV